jgi:hypothetical protein
MLSVVMEMNEESDILYLFCRRNTKKKKEGTGLELTDPLALDQNAEELAVAEVPITGSPAVTIIESLDGSLASVATSVASSLTASTPATTITIITTTTTATTTTTTATTTTTTTTSGIDHLSVIDTPGKTAEDDSDKPVFIKDSEDPASPNKSLSESSVKGTPTSKKPKRDRKPKVKAIFPGKKNSK